MPCYYPIQAYNLTGCRTETGKQVFVFSESEVSGRAYKVQNIPCGQCIGCRLKRAKNWAIRCMHEASLYDSNCFITLTYDDKHLPKDGSLNKVDYKNFMKRLRFAFKGHNEVIEYDKNGNKKVTYPIRFYHAAEYGSKNFRPHHHALLFNFDFDDKQLLYTKKGKSGYKHYYYSPALAKLWTCGFHIISDCNFETAGYVARYITKKVTGLYSMTRYAKIESVDKQTGEIREFMQPEFSTMSNRPGIAARAFESVREDIYPKDYLTYKGAKLKPPPYYDNLLEKVDETMVEAVKRARVRWYEEHKSDKEYTPKRMTAKCNILMKKINKLKRGYENDHENVQYLRQGNAGLRSSRILSQCSPRKSGFREDFFKSGPTVLV